MTSSQRKRRRASDRLRVFPKDPDAQHLADHEIRHRLGDKDHLGRGRSNWPLIRSRTTTLPMSTRDVGPGQRSDANRAAQRALGAFVQRALPLQADPVQRPLVARAHGDIANVDHDCPPVVPRQINHIRDVPPCGPITPPIGTSLSGSSNPPPTARRRKRDPSPVARPDQPAKELPSRTCAKVQKSSGSTPISRTIAPSAPHLFADRRPDENGANRLCDHAKSRRNPDQTPCVAIDHLT